MKETTVTVVAWRFIKKEGGMLAHCANTNHPPSIHLLKATMHQPSRGPPQQPPCRRAGAASATMDNPFGEFGIVS